MRVNFGTQAHMERLHAALCMYCGAAASLMQPYQSTILHSLHIVDLMADATVCAYALLLLLDGTETGQRT